MSKESWIAAYDEKYDECIEQGLRPAEADKQAVKWAEGAFERLQDYADNLRKAARGG